MPFSKLNILQVFPAWLRLLSRRLEKHEKATNGKQLRAVQPIQGQRIGLIVEILVDQPVKH